VKKGLPVLFKEYPIGKARHRSRRQRCDELIKVLPVLRDVLRLHLVSMACDSHLVVLAIQAWGGERGTVDVQRLCLVSWKPRSTAWRTQANVAFSGERVNARTSNLGVEDCYMLGCGSEAVMFESCQGVCGRTTKSVVPHV
jgi:hypothetical protein